MLFPLLQWEGVFRRFLETQALENCEKNDHYLVKTTLLSVCTWKTPFFKIRSLLWTTVHIFLMIKDSAPNSENCYGCAVDSIPSYLKHARLWLRVVMPSTYLKLVQLTTLEVVNSVVNFHRPGLPLLTVELNIHTGICACSDDITGPHPHCPRYT